jgi:nucleoside-triphosphatase THEP1
MANSKTKSHQRLIVLWALAETALGGFLHAFKLPITGFVVGGFAVICISLLAHRSAHPWRDILAATTLVLLAKLALSPQSPPTAYLAVAFQGVAGAALFQLLPFRIAAPIFGVIAMLESAVQKILVLTLLFGTQIWSALDQYAVQLLTGFGITAPEHLASGYMVGGFALVYALWGLYLGIWVISFAENAQKTRFSPLKAGMHKPIEQNQDSAPQYKKVAKPRQNRTIIAAAIGILCLVLILAFGNHLIHPAIWVALRATILILLATLVLKPLFQNMIQRWASDKQTSHGNQLQVVLSSLEAIGPMVQSNWQLAGAQHRGLRRVQVFLTNLLAWAYAPYAIMQGGICILAGPIRSGKTSALQAWVTKQPLGTIGGFLTPDSPNGRVLLMLHDRMEHPFEVSEGTKDAISVGRYYFAHEAFQIGQVVLKCMPSTSYKVSIIDEVGKLELAGAGFEPALSTCIAAMQNQTEKTLILVVRDTLLDQVVAKYKLHNCLIINQKDLADVNFA